MILVWTYFLELIYPKRIKKIMQVDKKYITNSPKQTQKFGEKTAKDVLALRRSAPQDENNSAVIFGLSGNLGGGKTTFLQGFARGLNIKEKILSPTFVIQKRFSLKNRYFKNFYHIDCYRLKNQKDVLELGLKDIIKDPENIVAIEWPEKIKKALPKAAIFIDFKFIDKNKREIKIKV